MIEMNNVSSQNSVQVNDDNLINSSTEQLFLETNVRRRYATTGYLVIGVGVLVLLSSIALIGWSISSNYEKNSLDQKNDTITGTFKLNVSIR